ncbi:MAG TPA: CinA family nicotinamide mononucleotide deamidase-related protein, partial [Gemmatimonadales bacterium]|nr:CinA family nicotinamide mononucleotide deamidase-related protein [Gemmatimonadales bacterium]
MDLELLTIGTELLLGFTLDTNGAEIARALAAIGVRVVRRTSVGDTPAAIRDAVREALSRTGAVLTTGGLGPTRDDMSKTVVAELYGMPLEFDERIWQELVARFARLGRAPAPSNRSQAEVPRGAVVLPNRWGTAPGLWFEGPPGLVIMLPGVPGEMRKLVEHEVVPRLAARGQGDVIRSRVVRTTGIPESTLAERLGEIERDVAPLTLAYLPGFDGVDLRLSAWGLAPDEADARLATGAGLLLERAGPFAYGEGEVDLAAIVLDRARANRLRVGTAESCTGGLVGGRLTAIAGSSDVFTGGVICYSNELKISLLGVSPALIAADGAVSESVACAMALGAVRALGVDLSVAVTGIAGPGGGSEAKPVGTVWLAVADGEVVAAR